MSESKRRARYRIFRGRSTWQSPALLPSSIRLTLCSASPRKTSPRCVLKRPYNTFLRFFGMSNCHIESGIGVNPFSLDAGRSPKIRGVDGRSNRG